MPLYGEVCEVKGQMLRLESCNQPIWTNVDVDSSILVSFPDVPDNQF